VRKLVRVLWINSASIT